MVHNTINDNSLESSSTYEGSFMTVFKALIKPALGITLQCVGFELTEGSGK